MGYCCVYGCRTSSSTPGNSFFRFPLDNKVVLQQWIARIKRKNFKPGKSSRICQLHFEKECFEPSSNAEFLSSIGFSGNRLPKLKPDSVPTIFNYTEPKTPRESTKRSTAQKRRRKELLSETIEDINYENVSESSISHFQSSYISLDIIEQESKFVNAACQTETLTYTESLNTQNTGNKKLKSTYSQTNAIKTLRKCIQTEENVTLAVETQCNIAISNNNLDVQEHDISESEISNEALRVSNLYSDPHFTPDTFSESKLESKTEGTCMPQSFERKYIAFESCLLALFSTCFICNLPSIARIKRIVGTMVTLQSECANHHVKIWNSQPTSGMMPIGNLMAAASILFSGSPLRTVNNTFKFMQIPFISSRSFIKIQTFYLYPSIMLLWKKEESKIMTEYRMSGKRHKFGGDARMISSGLTPKYGFYYIRNLETGEILTFQLVQCNEVKSSNAMEGLKRCMEVLEKQEVHVQTLVTDRNLHVRKYLRETYPEIEHQIDVRHIAKAVGKKLTQASKYTDCTLLEKWNQSIQNHLRWLACSSPGRPLEKRDKWISLLNHVSNKHENHSLPYFENCMHQPFDESQSGKEWIREGSRAHKQLSKIVRNTRLCNDVKIVSSENHSSSFERFHLLKRAVQSDSFFYEEMLSRLSLAALHNNENCKRLHEETVERNPQFRISCPKSKKRECMISVIQEDTTYEYVNELLQLVMERMRIAPTYKAAEELLKLETSDIHQL